MTEIAIQDHALVTKAGIVRTRFQAAAHMLDQGIGWIIDIVAACLVLV